MIFLTGAEAQLAEVLAALGQFTGKVDAILAAFEPEGMAVAEDQEAWVAGRLRQEGCRGRGPVHPGTREVPLPGGQLGADG